ncbi:hypothetical protein QTH43_14405 [Clostridium perfringens]|uniref:hypothetical protein n=1 Tax=Clostridium perfringens TaxID=1502 RepID=UPI0039E8D67B|nr:hypothetical protein [Clostridium perfringens]
MFNDLVKLLKENINKKISASELDKLTNKLIEEGYEETIEDIGDYVFRINFLKNKQKVLFIDYAANIFNETVTVKNVRLYLENI